MNAPRPERAMRAAVILSLGLAACTVGPNFKPLVLKPPASLGPSLDPSAPLFTSDGVSGAWWQLFDDPELSSLITRLVDQDIDLKTAAERVQQARQQVRLARAPGLPSVNGAASIQHERVSANGILVNIQPTPDARYEYDEYDAGPSASWELDLFGQVRRSVEAAKAGAQAQEEARRGVALMAVADLAQDYIQLRGLQAREAIVRTNLEIARDTLRLVQSRVTGGVTTQLELANARAQVDAVAAQLPDLFSQRTQIINAIGVLLALPPGALSAELELSGPIPAVSQPVPVGLPADLARRRPDIRQAEAQLHVATAQTGVAIASFYPSVTLTGSFTFDTLTAADWFAPGSRMFSVGPALTVPIFQGGRLKATLRLDESKQREAALAYRETVIGAWREVDDAMTAYAKMREQQSLDADVVQLNEVALAAARSRFRAGSVDFLNVLSVQINLLQSQTVVAQAQQDAGTRLVTLFRALGGGWELSNPQTIAVRSDDGPNAK